jgi:hypothetical protein
MKIRLLLKTLRWVTKRYTKFNLFGYYPSDHIKYYGNFDYLEYFSSDKFPTKTVSTYSGYRTSDDIKKEYNHHLIRSMYSIIGWIRCIRYKYRLESERKNITKLLK